MGTYSAISTYRKRWRAVLRINFETQIGIINSLSEKSPSLFVGPENETLYCAWNFFFRGGIFSRSNDRWVQERVDPGALYL